MNSFDIIGPVMVGPSSSHTAGAVKIGNISRKLLGAPVRKADIFSTVLSLPRERGMGRTEPWWQDCWAFRWTIPGFRNRSAMPRRPEWNTACQALT